MEFTFFMFWLVFSVVVAIGAAGRGRHGPGWFLLSMVISPLLAFLLLMMLPSRSKSAGAPETQELRKCPECAELILREAKKCKHCGSGVEPGSPVQEASVPYDVGKALGRAPGGAGTGQEARRRRGS